MTTIEEMEEFVNWENAAAASGQRPSSDFLSFDIDPALPAMTMDPAPENIDLALENATEDDFSFSAMQYFTDENALAAANATVPEMPTGNNYPTDFWETPEFPCSSCTLGAYACKKIREGRYKDYCTSCVALNVDCSFGGVVPESVNPRASMNLSATPFPDMATASGAIHSDDLVHQIPSNRSSCQDLYNLATIEEPAVVAPRPEAPPPKIGARFSRESIRVLKTWLTTHNRHPYPSDEEKELLQRKTGLSKTQITTWLANARRRGKVQPPRSTSPHPANRSTHVGSIDIPQRRGTPALETMNPLQRWEHSPPEHEPASVTAIARAVTASSSAISSGINSPYSLNFTDDGSSRSLCNQSSASSLGTSQSSNGSSAYSHNSHNSWASFGSAPFNQRSRRRGGRRATPQKPGSGKTELHPPLRTFQCTFCTETFRTKHDWQRHEKSLHLSLERWVCTPHGSRAVNPETSQLSCVFCGTPNPDDAHIEAHNHSTCQERSLSERTFYRKDHLNQHLRLVHNVKFMDWSMKSWKIASPEIRSRCGFCGIVMDTWTIRVDHLAEHFKTGYSMADWKGDWGFDVPVLDMVENSIPPYLIHHERTSPFPYVAAQSPPESPRNAYELIKLEMAYFDANHREQHGRPPTDEEMMVEGSRIIFASETLSLQGIATQASWLRDLIMNSEELTRKARFGPVRGAAENRLASLKINGKDNLFEQCPMEFQLQEFVKDKRLLGLTAMDDELQEEACRIVGRVEEVSTHPSEAVSNWLLRLITSSTTWLASFRRRAQLPRSEDVVNEIIRSKDPTSIDSTIHSYSRLERELADFLKLRRALGVEPSDEDLQRQARIIIYEFDDGWNQTAADNITWLEAFKNRHPPDGPSPPSASSHSFSQQRTAQSTAMTVDTPYASSPASKSPNWTGGLSTKAIEASGGTVTKNPFFLNDANCYNRLSRELGRWVAATMSPNNPNQHVPTDAELQHQARFILYDEDDPWNQTAADNAEWLQRFKRDNGIINDNGPGLTDSPSWALEQGGTGFAPPYAFPKGRASPGSGPIGGFDSDVQVPMAVHNTRFFQAGQTVANSFVENLGSRYARPATIFCSRELEDGLVRATEREVAQTGCVPTAGKLQAHAREILGRHPGDQTATPADDPELTRKFQRWMLERMPHARPPVDEGTEEYQKHQDPGEMPSFLDMQVSDEELGKILQDMDFDLSQEKGAHGQGEDERDEGVRLTDFGI